MMNLSAIRRVLTILLVIPLGMIVYVYLFPDWQLEHPNLEFPFLIIGVPIVILNYFLWFRPEFFQTYFQVIENPVRIKNEKFALLMNLAGVFAALTLVGVGTASVISRISATPALEPSTTQGTEVADFPAFGGSSSSGLSADELPATKLPSLTSESNETGVVSISTLSTAVVKIPVSGGEPSSTPAPSRTPNKVASPTIIAKNTAGPSASCALASSQFLEAIREVIVDNSLNYTVQRGWAVQSNRAEDLWFVAAKVRGDDIETGVSLPGVWGLYVYSDGYIDIYAINDIAQEYSYTLWGEDGDPVLSMESDSAQSAYDCDLSENN